MLTVPCVVWIATTFNSDYLKMRGWKSVISSTYHRQEFVAGNLAYHAMSGIIMIIWFWSLPCSIAFAEFKQASDKVGSHDADWNEIEDMIDIRGYGRRNFYRPLSHIPQVSTVKRCTQPSSHIFHHAAADYLHVPRSALPFYHPYLTCLTYSRSRRC